MHGSNDWLTGDWPVVRTGCISFFLDVISTDHEKADELLAGYRGASEYRVKRRRGDDGDNGGGGGGDGDDDDGGGADEDDALDVEDEGGGRRPPREVWRSASHRKEAESGAGAEGVYGDDVGGKEGKGGAAVPKGKGRGTRRPAGVASKSAPLRPRHVEEEKDGEESESGDDGRGAVRGTRPELGEQSGQAEQGLRQRRKTPRADSTPYAD